MNKLCYRIVFNKVRGMLMAVGEVARRNAKSGESSGQGGSVGTAAGVGMLLLSGGMIWVPSLHAQIVADPAAPGVQRPTVLSAANGVVQVNIQTPSPAGVSRNTYRQFDVAANGVILNNARNNAGTQLGGQIQGNPWLATGTARVILNEVNSASPSQLRGYLEVGGDRAEVIIANPAGIVCGGCGFINVGRSTLSTGVPVLSDGRLEGFRVSGGLIRVEGAGLDARSSDYTRLIARALEINAGVWAQDLNVVAGAAHVPADGSPVTPVPGAGQAPAVALDVAALGGMYAGKITLIGTESGVGMRSAGQIGASAGDVRITSEGWIENSGQISSSGALAVRAADALESSGTLFAGTHATLSGDDRVSLDGQVYAAGDVAVVAAGPAGRISGGGSSILVAGYQAGGMVGATGSVSLDATIRAGSSGMMLAGAGIEARSASLDFSGAELAAPGIALHANQGGMNLSATRLTARESFAASTSGLLDSSLATISANRLQLQAYSLDNTGGSLLQSGAAAMQFNFAGTLDNTRGRIASNGDAVRLSADALSNAGGYIEHAGAGTLEIWGQSVVGARGQIVTNGALVIKAGQLDLDAADTRASRLTIDAARFSHRQGQLVQTGHDTAVIKVAGRLDNQAGRLASSGGLALTGDTIHNAAGQIEAVQGAGSIITNRLDNSGGRVFAATDLGVRAGEVINPTGSFYAGQDLSLVLGGSLTHGGVIGAGRALSVSAAAINAAESSVFAAGLQADGRLAGGGALGLTTQDTLAAHGRNLAAGTASFQAGQLDLSGSQTSAAALRLGTRAADLHSATLVAAGLLQARVDGLLDSRQAFVSAERLDLQADRLDNTGGELRHTGLGDVQLSLPGGLLNTGGRIVSNGAMSVQVGHLDNRAGVIVTTDDKALRVSASTTLDNRDGGRLGAGGLASFAAPQIDNSGGIVTAGGQLVVSARRELVNTGGTIAGNQGLTLDAGRLANVDGQIESAAGPMSVVTGVFDNARGQLYTASDLHIHAVELLNPTGSLYATRDLGLVLSGGIVHGGVIGAGRELTIAAGSLDAGDKSLIAAGLQRDGRLGGSGHLNINVRDTLAAHGQNLSAGAAGFQAANLDLSGSLTSAQALSLAAGSVDLHSAEVVSAGPLQLRSSGPVDSRKAVMSAGLLDLQAGSLDNTEGELLQTGQADTQFVLSGNLTNTRGRIASNGANVRLDALTLNNTAGRIEHAGSGSLQLRGQTFSGVDGQLTSNGFLNLAAGRVELDAARTTADRVSIVADVIHHHGADLRQTGSGAGAITTSGAFDNRAGLIAGNGDFTFTVGSLDNRGGEIVTAGVHDLTIRTAADVDNRDGGRIGAGGSVVLDARRIDNTGGSLAAAQHLAVTSSSDLTNTAGVLAGNRGVTLAAQGLSNAGGRIESAAGAVSVDTGALENTRGQLFAATQLGIRATDVFNPTGSFYAAQDLVMALTGRLAHGGVIGAGRDATVSAAAIEGAASSLFAAGLRADGRLTEAGTLSLAAREILVAHGQNLAGGGLTLQAGQLDVAGSQTSAHGVTLVADRVEARAAELLASGTFQARVGGLLDTRLARVSAQQVNIQAGSLDNADGELVHTGRDDMQLVLPGNLTNTRGRIASNGTTLRLGAETLDNSAGSIEHAGTGDLLIGASTFDGTSGQIRSNGHLDLAASRVELDRARTAAERVSITADTISHRYGELHQTGSGLATLSANGLLDNLAGLITGNGSVALSAGTLDNRGGAVVVAGSHDLGVVVGGDLDNRAGRINAGGNVDVRTGGVANSQGEISSGGALAVSASGAISNHDGFVAGTKGLRITATELDNTTGTLAAVDAVAVLEVRGAVLNAGGKLMASGALDFSAGALDNTTGTLSASSLRIGTGYLANRGGRMLATGSRDAGALRIDSALLDNREGLIQARGPLVIDTHGHALDNSGTDAVGGIIGAADVFLRTGALANQRGYAGSGGRLDIAAATVDNTLGGTLFGQGEVTLQAFSLNNAAGRIRGQDSVRLAISDAFDNTAGLIQADQTLEISAARVTNTLTRSEGLGIEGRRVSLTAGVVDNRDGTLRADESLQITSGGTVDNTRGLISSLGSLSIADPDSAGPSLRITNAAGTLIAGRFLAINAFRLSGDGRALSWGDLGVRLVGDFSNDGEIGANGNASIELPGVLTNRASLWAGGILRLRAGTIDNRATGEILASQTLLQATDSHTLINRGLIDAGTNRIESAIIQNLGTGRIYGDHLAIQADTLDNLAEGDHAPVIAARERLDLGVGILRNQDHALLFSAGDFAIGGALDGSNRAIGRAAHVLNSSATVEAMGNLSLAAGRIDNLDAHFSTTVARVSTEDKLEYSFGGLPYRYDISEVRFNHVLKDSVLNLVLLKEYDDGRWTSGEWFNEYRFIRTVDETQIVSTDPGRILAGGNLLVEGDHLTNDKSRIIAGGRLLADVVNLENIAATGLRTTADTGTVTDYWRKPDSGRDIQGKRRVDYIPAPTIQTITLVTPVLAENGAVSGSGTHLDPRSSTRVSSTAQGSGSAKLTPRGPQLIEVRASVDTTGTISGTPVEAASESPLPGGTGVSTGAPASVAAGTAVAAPAAAPVAGQAAGVPDAAALLTSKTHAQPGIAEAVSSPAARIAIGPTVSGAAAIEAPPRMVIRTLTPSFGLPDSSLFQAHPEPSARYLVETDPRFTSSSAWLSSDYLLAALAVDAATVQKRLGDGFYEQRLVREQVAQLTGRRFLGAYASDEAEFEGLMAAGVAYAKAWNLRPGIALTADQMARLTTDIVWLVETSVTLADGRTQTVLVPQVYARVRESDIDGSGGLLSGSAISLAATERLLNTGTLAGGELVSLSATSIRNEGGRITGNKILAAAGEDLENIGGRIEAQQQLVLSAGRDITVASTTGATTSAQGSRTYVDRLATLHVSGGLLAVEAGRDLRLDANEIINTSPTAAGPAGETALIAGRNLSLGTVTESSQQDIVWNARNYRREGQSTEVGTTVSATGNLRLQAGQDLKARAAQVTSDLGDVVVGAGGNIDLAAGAGRVQLDEGHQTKARGFLSSRTITTRDVLDRTTALATTLSGNTVSVVAEKDIRVSGSNVVSTARTTLEAGKAIIVEAATESRQESHDKRVKESGLLGAKGVGFTVGSRTLTTEQAKAQTTARASTIGSTDGDVLIRAGNDYTQTGSQVVASSGSIQISGAALNIKEARQTSNEQTHTAFRQSGLDVELKGGMIDTARGMSNSGDAMTDGSNDKTQRLHMLNFYAQSAKLWESGRAVMKAYDEGGTNDGAAKSDIKLSVSFSSNRSDSSAQTISNTSAGSSIKSEQNIALVARNEDISIRGSRVDAAGAVGLSAARDVKLAASQDTQINQSQNSSSGYSVGVSANAGKKSPGVTLDLAANMGKGKGNAESVAYANSHLTGGQAVYVQSGRDTELAGATVDAPHISMSAGRDLTLSSLQDWSTSRSVQRNIGVSASIAIYGPATSNVSASFARSTSNSDYLGVNEQTAVRAGVGGFDILVGAHTALNGAVIASAAAPAHNSLITGTLSTTDLANRFDASAESRGLTLSSSMFDGKYQTIKSVTGNLLNNGNAEAHDQSRTLSAISGGNVVIRDEVGQVMRSGQSAQATVANLWRDTSATHRSLEQVDVGELTQEARREQADNMLAFSTLTAFTDEAYRRAFVDAAKLYKIERNEENEPVYVEVAQADWLNLEKGDDGKVHVSNNGIFNTLEDASKNALQNSAEYRGPQYLIYFPQSDNIISEFMIAGYMKVLDNGFFGLTNATQKTVDLMNQYGNDGLDVSGHSRGGMTVGNALEALMATKSSEKIITATNLKFFGSAYNAKKADDMLSSLSGGGGRVEMQTHMDDLVGIYLGGNPSTGGTTREGWTKLADWLYMFKGKDTVHNCYGHGSEACRDYWGMTFPKSVTVKRVVNESN